MGQRCRGPAWGAALTVQTPDRFSGTVSTLWDLTDLDSCCWLSDLVKLPIFCPQFLICKMQ